MNYISVKIEIEKPTETAQEILIALLENTGYEAFEQTEHGLNAYIKKEEFDTSELENIKVLSPTPILHIEYEIMPNKDWNAEWEANYQPVVIANKVLIKSTFHTNTPSCEYEITIDPKMSFGTGHHATTSLMVQAILKQDCKSKTVLDMGCGTGILGILCAVMGAQQVKGIDIDEWAFRNANENCKLNHIKNMSVELGNALSLSSNMYDLVLANINRNILLEDMKHYSKALKNDGTLIISGFYTQDIDSLVKEAENQDLKKKELMEENDWICIIFEKNN